MTNYYVMYRRISDDRPGIPDGPYRTHDEATASIAATFSQSPVRNFHPVILLDLGSVDIRNLDEIDDLLMRDPLLHAVFTFGRQIGHSEQIAHPESERRTGVSNSHSC